MGYRKIFILWLLTLGACNAGVRQSIGDQSLRGASSSANLSHPSATSGYFSIDTYSSTSLDFVAAADTPALTNVYARATNARAVADADYATARADDARVRTACARTFSTNGRAAVTPGSYIRAASTCKAAAAAYDRAAKSAADCAAASDAARSAVYVNAARAAYGYASVLQAHAGAVLAATSFVLAYDRIVQVSEAPINNARKIVSINVHNNTATDARNRMRDAAKCSYAAHKRACAAAADAALRFASATRDAVGKVAAVLESVRIPATIAAEAIDRI